MNRVGTKLLVCMCVAGVPFANRPAAAASATEAALEQAEHDWAEALKVGDVDKVSRILADDWAGLDTRGHMDTKQSLLARVKSGNSAVMGYALGPINAFVYGDTAVLQGSIIETWKHGGTSRHGEFDWMDVFIKRNGEWRVVRSMSGNLQIWHALASTR